MSSQQSFVVRCWRLGRRDQRIEVEHVQSGERRLARSTGEALEWIDEFGERGCERRAVSGEGVREQGTGSRE